MSRLIQYAALLEGAPPARPAPVERWNPPDCGESDITIRRDGVWLHEGTPIERAALVRLFAGVLRKEGDRYFLVTPVEKLSVVVEDAPFLAVLVDRIAEGPAQRLTFTTNVGEKITASADNPIEYRPYDGGKAAYLHIRAGLDARIARAPFHDLVAVGEIREVRGENWFGVASAGEFFPFELATDLDRD